MIDNTAKPKTTSFSPLQKFKGNQPVSKMATMHLAHLEEESAKREEEDKTKDPDGINGIMKEFMVHLAWVMKDTQVQEKHCYHCSSPEHFIHDCPLVRASKGGDGIKEGSPDTLDENDNAQEPPEGGS